MPSRVLLPSEASSKSPYVTICAVNPRERMERKKMVVRRQEVASSSRVCTSLPKTVGCGIRTDGPGSALRRRLRRITG